jgi:hypothetical protein
VKKSILLALCVGVSIHQIHAYEVAANTPGAALPFTPTYYAAGNTQIVYLDDEERAKLDYALRFFLDTEQEGNQRIDAALIRRVKAACSANDACPLIDKVMGDFKHKKLRDLFLAVGLRSDL